MAVPATAPAPPRRRSQHERRAATIGRLVDAAIHLLVERGYSGTSTPAVCARAGVSQGGLFRHFATRIDFMIAVADTVQTRLLTRYRERFDARAGRADPVELAVTLCQDNAHSDLQHAWFELLVAARTEATLRDALGDLWRRNMAANRELAATLLPDHAERAAKRLPALVDLMVMMFHGEALNHVFGDAPDALAANRKLAISLVRSALDAKDPA